MCSWQYVLAIFAMLSCATRLLALDSEERHLLELVRIANRAPVQSIHDFSTFSCRFASWDETSQGRFETSGTYYRSLDIVRQQTVTRHPDGAEQTNDLLIQNGRKLNFSKQRTVNGKVVSGQSFSRRLPFPGDEVWWNAHLTFFGDQGTTVTFDELLNKRNELRQVKRVNVKGRELVYVDLVFENVRFGLWFDPQVNYLVQKKAQGSPKRWEQEHSEHEVVRFKELAPAIYFPAEVSVGTYRNGRLERTGARTFSDIRVNQVLSPDTFELRLPAGSEVPDYDDGKVYKADGKGRYIEVKGKRAPVLSPINGVAATGKLQRTVTRVEPRPLDLLPKNWSRWYESL